MAFVQNSETYPLLNDKDAAPSQLRASIINQTREDDFDQHGSFQSKSRWKGTSMKVIACVLFGQIALVLGLVLFSFGFFTLGPFDSIKESGYTEAECVVKSKEFQHDPSHSVGAVRIQIVFLVDVYDSDTKELLLNETETCGYSTCLVCSRAPDEEPCEPQRILFEQFKVGESYPCWVDDTSSDSPTVVLVRAEDRDTFGSGVAMATVGTILGVAGIAACVFALFTYLRKVKR